VTRLLAVQPVSLDSIPDKDGRFLFLPKLLFRFWGSPSLRLILHRRRSRKRQDDWGVKVTPDFHVVPRLLSRSVPLFLLICLYKVRGDDFHVTESCRNYTHTAREDGLLLQKLLGLCLEERGFLWYALAGSFCCPIPSCNSIFMTSTLSPPQRAVRCFIYYYFVWGSNMSLFFLLIAQIKHTNELLSREEHKEKLECVAAVWFSN